MRRSRERIKNDAEEIERLAIWIQGVTMHIRDFANEEEILSRAPEIDTTLDNMKAVIRMYIDHKQPVKEDRERPWKKLSNIAESLHTMISLIEFAVEKYDEDLNINWDNVMHDIRGNTAALYNLLEVKKYEN